MSWFGFRSSAAKNEEQISERISCEAAKGLAQRFQKQLSLEGQGLIITEDEILTNAEAERRIQSELSKGGSIPIWSLSTTVGLKRETVLEYLERISDKLIDGDTLYTANELGRLGESLRSESPVLAIDFCTRHGINLHVVKYLIDRTPSVVLVDNLIVAVDYLGQVKENVATQLKDASAPVFLSSLNLPSDNRKVYLGLVPQWLKELRLGGYLDSTSGTYFSKPFLSESQERIAEKLAKEGYISLVGSPDLDNVLRAKKLSKFISEFRDSHPGTEVTQVREALVTNRFVQGIYDELIQQVTETGLVDATMELAGDLQKIGDIISRNELLGLLELKSSCGVERITSPKSQYFISKSYKDILKAKIKASVLALAAEDAKKLKVDVSVMNCDEADISATIRKITRRLDYSRIFGDFEEPRAVLIKVAGKQEQLQVAYDDAVVNSALQKIIEQNVSRLSAMLVYINGIESLKQSGYENPALASELYEHSIKTYGLSELEKEESVEQFAKSIKASMEDHPALLEKEYREILETFKRIAQSARDPAKLLHAAVTIQWSEQWLKHNNEYAVVRSTGKLVPKILACLTKVFGDKAETNFDDLISLKNMIVKKQNIDADLIERVRKIATA